MKLIQNVPKIQDADLMNKVVLLRVDHNVVKKGKIEDPMRIEASLPTIMYIIRHGGHPIIMTHVGRPYDKKKGTITMGDESSVKAVVDYLRHRLHIDPVVPEFKIVSEKGILGIDTSINLLVKKLRNREIDAIYLPNTRWFQGEEAEDDRAVDFGVQLSAIADIYVNDAFGSWQPHVSTIEPAKYLPSYAGLLMQKELENLYRIFNPERPFVGIVAGSKFDTKIDPLLALFEKADQLILGGVIYNAYLCAKYGIRIKGIDEDDIQSAKTFVQLVAKTPEKLVELPYVVESDTLEGKVEGQYRTRDIRTLKAGDELGYVLDVDPKSFEEEAIRKIILGAKTIFVNAVMGFVPNFGSGSAAMYGLIDQNAECLRLFGGGDTIQEFGNLLPKVFDKATRNPKYYFFTGGGTILMAIQEGSAYGLEPIKILISNMEG